VVAASLAAMLAALADAFHPSFQARDSHAGSRGETEDTDSPLAWALMPTMRSIFSRHFFSCNLVILFFLWWVGELNQRNSSALSA